MPKHKPILRFRDREIETSMHEAARIAVAVLMKYYGKLDHIMKKGAIDLVTCADQEAEEKALRYLRRRHPDHAFIAEESWDGKKIVPSGYAWVLDPLDGTTNYAHGMENFAFSLGVAYDGDPVAAIVVEPIRDYTYRAFKGRGAYRNKKRLHVSSKTKLGDCLIGHGMPYNRRGIIPELTAIMSGFIKRTHGLRRLGTASLDFALVASGHLDGFHELSLQSWDVAAGALLVTEAGGVVTDYDGKPFGLFNDSFVAASPAINRAMVRVIKRALKDVEKSG